MMMMMMMILIYIWREKVEPDYPRTSQGVWRRAKLGIIYKSKPQKAFHAIGIASLC
jgi:hypothetical protein